MWPADYYGVHRVFLFAIIIDAAILNATDWLVGWLASLRRRFEWEGAYLTGVFGLVWVKRWLLDLFFNVWLWCLSQMSYALRSFAMLAVGACSLFLCRLALAQGDPLSLGSPVVPPSSGTANLYVVAWSVGRAGCSRLAQKRLRLRLGFRPLHSSRLSEVAEGLDIADFIVPVLPSQLVWLVLKGVFMPLLAVLTSP